MSANDEREAHLEAMHVGADGLAGKGLNGSVPKLLGLLAGLYHSRFSG